MAGKSGKSGVTGRTICADCGKRLTTGYVFEYDPTRHQWYTMHQKCWQAFKLAGYIFRGDRGDYR
jgi:hypothetical protein